MSDDYLFDRSGPPDPDVEALEDALDGLRYDRPAPELPRRRHRFPWVLIAAALVVGVGVFALMVATRDTTDPDTPPEDVAASGWRFALMTTGDTPTGPERQEGTLDVGGWLETDGQSRAELEVADIGRLTLDPESRLQLLATGEDQHRIHLERGRMHAKVDAPPELFITETPAATAVDMGCEYTLEVDEEGNGLLEVSLGRVELRRAEFRSIVPERARCEARAEQGLGTPYFDTASPPFRIALREIDFEQGGTEALDNVLDSASSRDTLTLWHLLQHPRFAGAERERILDTMEAFHELPVELTREGLLELDPVMLDDWFWKQLYWTW